jgi:microcystin-dependent protein
MHDHSRMVSFLKNRTMKAIILLITCLLAFPGNLQASDLITYQGKLTDAASTPLPDGQYRIGVRIWDQAVPVEGAVPLWARKYDVPVAAGVFSLMIGAEGLPWGTVGQAGGPLTASLKLALSGTSRFVEITVMSDANGAEKPAGQWQVLLPRQALGAVPYAMNGVPSGTVVPFAGVVIPDGWVRCDGAAYPSSDPRYAALFAAIQNSFGGGVGTFGVPDLRGRAAIGSGQGSGLTNRLLAQTAGAETHTLTVAEMPGHNHSVNLTTTSNGAHTHTVPLKPHGNNNGGGAEAGNDGNSGTVTTSSSGLHTHQVVGDTFTTGGSVPHNIMQPVLVLNYMIKL